jgi:hypothetical protein
MDTPEEDDALVAVESAGKLANIPPRTLRHWISTGKLPATAGVRGKLVRMGDVRRIAVLTGRDVGNVGNVPDVAGDFAGGKPGKIAESPVTVDWIDAEEALPPLPASGGITASARSQLESIRDEWLQPLITQIAELSRENGRLEERESVATQRAQAAEQARRDEADQADQLVNLLEDRIRELERMMGDREDRQT